MFTLTIKNLVAHRMRLISTALAVLLGVAFMTGTLVFNDTLEATFDNVVADANAGIDAAVRAPSPVDLSYGQAGPRIDPSLAETIAAVDGVDAVGVQVFGYAQLVAPDGTPVGDLDDAPAFGLNWVEVDAMNPYELVEGTAPQHENQIVIDRAAARSTGYQTGDEVTVLSSQAPRQFVISGVATFGGADSIGGGSSVLFDETTALELLSPSRMVDAITMTASPGVSQIDLVEAVTDAIGIEEVEVVTGAQVVDEDQAAFADQLAPFRMFMMIFAFVAVFVGAFIINNTFAITVAQRSPEMAMLRTIGAGRRQVLWSVLAEAAIIGVLASGAGLVVGVAIARALDALMGAFGIELPDGPTVVQTGSLLTAFGVGVGVTLASAMLPARQAGRIRPIAALRQVAVDRNETSRLRVVVGAVVAAGGSATLLAGLDGSDPAVIGLGALLTLIATSILAPAIARGFTSVLGVPLRLVGISGEMATRNAQRSAGRTARTASSLMIGVALVSFISIVAASFTTSFASALDHDFRGTHVVDSGAFDGQGGISTELAETLRSTPGVDTVMAARVTSARVDGHEVTNFAAFDAQAMTMMFDLGEIEGDVAGLGQDGIAVSRKSADANGWGLGSTPTLSLPSGDVPVRVEAIFEDAAWVGDEFVGTALFDRHLPTQLDHRIYVDGDDAGVRRAAARYSSAEVLDRAEFEASASAEIDKILGIIYVLLAMAVVISLFGIANTMALSVFERTREIGLLRAIGMTRRQVRSTVRAEAVVIAVFGTTLGLAVGTFFGWAMIRSLADQGIDTLSLPVARLAVIAVAAAASAAAAAALPARRAARLDVLQALQAQ